MSTWQVEYVVYVMVEADSKYHAEHRAQDHLAANPKEYGHLSVSAEVLIADGKVIDALCIHEIDEHGELIT